MAVSSTNMDLFVDEREFLHHFVQHSSRLMWFLGAGTSRSSGLPAAMDLIWDLKRRYYCASENQDIQSHNLSNHAIKAKIQAFFSGKGCPEAWSDEEYSYFFELMFGDNYPAQQAYIQDQLSPDKVTLTIGPRILAALLDMDRARLVFTTNFDNVLEDAYAAVAGKNLSSFNLEGSYAARDALNNEQFPIYAKIHGDFRYKNIKNLSTDLISNDEEIQACFISAASRYGLIVAGYSGRDNNVMTMFERALSQPNPFPHGIWWTVPNAPSVASTVTKFIEKARGFGINANIVETGTFDLMLNKIWRQIPDKPKLIDERVRSVISNPVSIPLPTQGSSYPVIRTNALEVVEMPIRCGKISAEGISSSDIFSKLREKQPDAVASYQNGIVFWGNSEELQNSLKELVNNDAEAHDLSHSIADIEQSTYLKSLFEHGIARALCHNKPVFLRKKGKSYYAVVDHNQTQHESLLSLKKAVGFRDNMGLVCGSIRGLKDTYWSECVRLKLDQRSGVTRLLLEPDIWIKPLINREHAREFLRTRKLKRYNRQSYEILNAWIEILIGPTGQAPVTVTYGADTDFPASFAVSTRTAFSRRANV